jgi:hypothetical protein
LYLYTKSFRVSENNIFEKIVDFVYFQEINDYDDRATCIESIAFNVLLTNVVMNCPQLQLWD